MDLGKSGWNVATSIFGKADSGKRNWTTAEVVILGASGGKEDHRATAR